MSPSAPSQNALRQAWRTNNVLIGVTFVFSIFANLLMLTGPLFMMQVYDRVLGSRSEATLVALFALVAMLYAMMAMIDFARGRLIARFGARLQSDLDAHVFAADLTANRTGPGGQNSGVQNLDTVQTCIASPAMLALMDVPWTPIFVAAIFVLNPVLGWMAVAGGGMLVLLTLANNQLTRRAANDAQTGADAAYRMATEARLGRDLIHAQGMHGAILNRWSRLRDTALRQAMTVQDRTGAFTATTKTFRLFLQSAMLAAGAWLALRNELSPGAIIAGSILLGRALSPIEQTLAQWPLIQRAMIAWRALSDQLSGAAAAGTATPLPRPEARITVNEVGVLGNGPTDAILRKINFDIPPGSVVGIIGPSGSGKTTLARVLVDLVQPATGDVLLGVRGCPITAPKRWDPGLGICRKT